MKRIIFSIIILGITQFSFAQEQQEVFTFDYLDYRLDLSQVPDDNDYSHFLGDRIGKKLFLLKESYTFQEEPTTSNPMPWIVIEKPNIYNNVKKLERYYKKGLKKGDFSEDEAISEYEKILDIALLVRNQETAQFETALENIKEEEEIASVFTSKVELNYF